MMFTSRIPLGMHLSVEKYPKKHPCIPLGMQNTIVTF